MHPVEYIPPKLEVFIVLGDMHFGVCYVSTIVVASDLASRLHPSFLFSIHLQTNTILSAFIQLSLFHTCTLTNKHYLCVLNSETLIYGTVSLEIYAEALYLESSISN